MDRRGQHAHPGEEERPGDVARRFNRDPLDRGVKLKTIQIIPSDGGGSQLPVPCYSSPLLNVLLFTRHLSLPLWGLPPDTGFVGSMNLPSSIPTFCWIRST